MGHVVDFVDLGAGLEGVLVRVNAFRRAGQPTPEWGSMEDMLEALFRASHKLAVYGTLVPGGPNHHVLESLGGEWHNGGVRGDLHQKGWGALQGYPAITWDPRADRVPVKLLVSDRLPSRWEQLAGNDPGSSACLVDVVRAVGDTAGVARAPKDLKSGIVLRDVRDNDLPVFFDYQLDPEANRMAAFTAKDPTDRDAFEAHWTRIRHDDTVTLRTIVCCDEVVGHIASFVRDGMPEVTYWIGRPYWGRGLATEALSEFLVHVTTRPLYARVATDNAASLRVLEKCGFAISGEDKGFANARGAEVEEYILALA